MDPEVKNYEIAYLISPNMPEDEMFGVAGKITGFIQDAHGLIGRIEEPRKRKLAYPIAKSGEAYFGSITFAIACERLPDLARRLREEPRIIRHLLVEEVKRPAIEFRERTSRRREGRLPSPTLEGVTAFTPAAPKEEDRTKIEELDKQLEEVLGK